MLIKGREDINRAVEGDHVIIELYPQKEWKSESDLLITNDNEGDEKAIETSSSANKILSGRVVGIARRNWRMYCGSLELVDAGTVVNYVCMKNWF